MRYNAIRNTKQMFAWRFFTMSQLAIAFIIIEVVLALAVVWGFMNEDFLIRLENHVFGMLVSKFRKEKAVAKAQPELVRKEQEQSNYAA